MERVKVAEMEIEDNIFYNIQYICLYICKICLSALILLCKLVRSPEMRNSN